VVEEAGSGRAWILGDDGSVVVLGRALAWATRRRTPELHIVVEDTGRGGHGIGASAEDVGGVAAVVARRAAEWSEPPSVWRVEGRSLVAPAPASFSPALPGPVKKTHALGKV
jgi:hypothetical protein